MDLLAETITENSAGSGNVKISLSGFENVSGSDFEDIVTGNDQANIIDGRGAADVFDAGLGEDVVLFDELDTSVSGGGDFDLGIYSGQSAASLTTYSHSLELVQGSQNTGAGDTLFVANSNETGLLH